MKGYGQLIILNGELCKDNKVFIDSGFNFGIGLFETILVREYPRFLKEHIERLNNGLGRLGIDNRVEEEYIYGLIDKYAIINCVLKIIVTEKNIVLSTREITYKEEDYIRGFDIKLSDLQRNEKSIFTYLKSLNYMDNFIERKRAVEEGYDEVIFLNTKNFLAEGSVSNIFFIKGREIFTPDINCGLLDGVIRRWVCKNYFVKEGFYSLEDIMDCDGAFITNSIMGIMEVNSIGGQKINRSNISKEIQHRYQSLL